MHQFWNTIKKIEKLDAYDFKLDKKKCCVDAETKIYLHLSRNLVILASVTCYLPFELSKCTSLRGHLLLSLSGVSLGNQQDLIGSENHLSKAYKTYLDYATRKDPPKKARKFKKPASPKLKTILASPKEPTSKGKRVKRAAKKASTALKIGVFIKDTSDKSVSKKKAPAKIEVPDEPTGKTKDTSEGTGVKAGVPDVSKDDSFDSNNDSWGDSEDESNDDHDKDDNYDEDDNDDDDGNDDDGHDDAQDSEQNYSDDEENHSFTLKDYEEEEQDKEVRARRRRCSCKLTMVHDKTEGPLQSSSISYDFTSKLLNLDDPFPDINSLMNTLAIPPPPPPINPSLHPTTIPQQQILDSTTTTYPTSFPEIPNFVSLFQFDQKLKEEVNVAIRLQSNKLKEEAKAEAKNLEFINQVYSTMKQIIKEQVKAQVSKIMPQIEKYFTESLGAEVLVRGRDDQDKDEDPSARSGQGMKRKKSSKDAEPSKGSKSKESKDFSKACFNPIKDICKSFAELKFHFKECYKAVDDRLDCHNSEGREYPFDLSKPLPLIEDQGCQVVHVDYFIHNDLKYLKGGSSSSKYVTFTTRTKSAKYKNTEGIEDMVPRLWSPIKVA
nr:hypothetical protein [Tanacetum cinerariifolium]